MATNELDWANLSFGYVPTDYNVRSTFRDGKWSPIEETDSTTIDLHIAATALHYGQEIFEDSRHSAAKTAKSAFSDSKKTPAASPNRPAACSWLRSPRSSSRKW